jgi:hypothetical protein
MWVATQHGFFSAVQSRYYDDDVVVRGRVIADVEFLAAWATAWVGAKHETIQVEKSDYPTRVVLNKGTWTDYLAWEVRELDYDNFKSRVDKVQSEERHHIYGGVWATLLELEKFNDLPEEEWDLLPVAVTKPSTSSFDLDVDLAREYPSLFPGFTQRQTKSGAKKKKAARPKK